MSISTEQLAQLLFGDPAPQGEAGTGAPMQSPMQPKPAPDPILAEVGSMVAQPAGDFRPQTVEYSPDGVATPQAAQLPPGASRAVSTKTADTGFSTNKLNEIDKTHVGRKGMAGKFDTAEAKVRSHYAADKANFATAYGEAEAATKAVGIAESDKIMAEAGHMNTIAGIQRTHADAMKALAVDGALAAQKAKDEYRARLMSIPELNPHALWDEAGKEGQFAMGVAAFVHDFLGAKGIKTSAMDTINQAIKNKIDSQIYNINTKKQVAQGFKDLYDMTVAESATKMEVEAKLQGYYLKAVESGIKAQMGSIDSNVARAKSQLALTEVRKAQAQKQFEIDQHIEEGIKAANQQLVQMRGQDMEAAIAKANRESAERIANARLKEEKKKDPKPRLYAFDGETGKGVLRVREGVPEALASKALEAAGSFYSADKEMLKLRELERKLDPQFDGFVGTRLSNEDARIYHATTLRLAHAMVKAMNEKATDKDVEQYLKSLPMPTDFTRGGVSRVLADTHAKMHNELDGVMLQVMEDVPENEQPQGPKNKLFGASAIDAEKGTKEAAGPSKNEEIATRLRSPDSLSPMSKKVQEEDGEYRAFTKPYWEDYVKKGNRTKVDISRSATADIGELAALGDAASGETPPKAFNELRELAEAAFHDDQEALAYLKEATKIRNTSEEEFQISEMASYFVDLLDKAKRGDVGSDGHHIYFGNN